MWLAAILWTYPKRKLPYLYIFLFPIEFVIFWYIFTCINIILYIKYMYFFTKFLSTQKITFRYGPWYKCNLQNNEDFFTYFYFRITYVYSLKKLATSYFIWVPKKIHEIWTNFFGQKKLPFFSHFRSSPPWVWLHPKYIKMCPKHSRINS